MGPQIILKVLGGHEMKSLRTTDVEEPWDCGIIPESQFAHVSWALI